MEIVKGMIIPATALLAIISNPIREKISRAMHYNLGRCGSYHNIIEAIESVIDAS